MNIPKSSLILILISIVVGCASTTPVTKYLPEQRQNVLPFFTSGQPIAAAQADEAFMLMSLEPTHVAGRPYIRLWLLYQNTSDQPYLLEPLKFTTLTAKCISRGMSESSMPESPTKILAHISNEKSKKMIMQAIGGTLQAMAVKPTTARTEVYAKSSPGLPAFTATTTVNDESEKRAEVHDRTVNAMMNTSMWYELYQNSISEGILRRNTLFPGQSANGYIYFPFNLPLVERYDPNRNRVVKDDLCHSKDFRYIVSLDMTTVTQEIKFVPIEGE